MLIRAANRADRTHTSEGEQIERGISEDIRCAVKWTEIAFAWRCRRFFFDEQDQRQRKHNNENAERLERRAPSEHLGQPVRQQWNSGTSNADAEIREAHRLTSGTIEPLRQQNLI